MVKLVAFSDPHIDINRKRYSTAYLEELVEYLEQLEPDILMVTGDVSPNIKELNEFLFQLKHLGTTRLFVPGNHDIWVNKNSRDGSWVKYYDLIPKLCQANGWISLPNNPIVINHTGFVGTIGWYDWSTRNKKFDDIVSVDHYLDKINPKTKVKWMDVVFAKFDGLTDKEVANHFLFEVYEDLQSLGLHLDIQNPGKLIAKVRKIYPKHKQEANTKIKTIVLGSHIVPFQRFIHYIGKLDWDFFTAFIGNLDLGQMISHVNSQMRKISVFGHLHKPNTSIIKGTEAYCTSIGYTNEWKQIAVKSVFQHSIQEIHL